MPEPGAREGQPRQSPFTKETLAEAEDPSFTHDVLTVFENNNPTATLLEHALLAQGFMGVQKATFPRCLRLQNRDFTCANLVEALK